MAQTLRREVSVSQLGARVVVREAGRLAAYRDFVNAFGGFMWEHRLRDVEGVWRVGSEVRECAERWARPGVPVFWRIRGDGEELPPGTMVFCGVPFVDDAELNRNDVLWTLFRDGVFYAFHAVVDWPIDA